MTRCLKNFSRVVLVVVGLVSAWIATMASAVAFFGTPEAVMVFVPRSSAINYFDQDIQLVRGGRHVLVVTSSKQHYVTRLYKSGAWLILPALRNGCLDLTAIQRRVKS